MSRQGAVERWWPTVFNRPMVVRVGYTNVRPIIPDEHVAWVLVDADSVVEGALLAAHIVGTHCEMVTSTEVMQ